MRKVFLLISFLMLVSGVAFVAYAAGHPEASFPWSNWATYVAYGVYIIVMIAFFVLGIRKQDTLFDRSGIR